MKNLNEGKKQKLHRQLTKAYDLGRRQSDFTFANYPVNSEGPNTISKASEVFTDRKKRNAVVRGLVKKHMKTFEEFMFIAKNYNVL